MTPDPAQSHLAPVERRNLPPSPRRIARLAAALASLPVLLAAAGSPALGGAVAAPSKFLSPPSAELDFVPGQAIVAFHASASPQQRRQVRAALGVEAASGLGGGDASLFQLPGGLAVEEAVARLRAFDAVALAEPNGISRAAATPNDPFLPQQWGLLNSGQTLTSDQGALGAAGIPGADIGATRAWDVTVGDPSVLVAVIDSGVDLLHRQLAGRLWENPGESGAGRESNGIDDDGDGLVDDVVGWDFAQGDATPQDTQGHGTNMAGIAAAAGNDGLEMTGVAQDVRLMALRVGVDKSFPNSDIVRAINFAGDHGAQVVNMSFGGALDPIVAEAIDRFPATVFVAAAGNKSSATADYPCRLPAANLICVAATGNRDELAGFSNYEAASVDLGAPGVNVLQTALPLAPPTGLHGGATYGSGTSQATAITSGAVALYRSARPAEDPPAVIQRLEVTADRIPSLAGRTATGARLDVGDALDFTPPQTTITAAPPPRSASSTASFAFQASEGGTFECELDGGDWQGCGSPAVYGGLALGAHRFRVRAVDGASNRDPTPALVEWTVVSALEPGGEHSSGAESTGVPPGAPAASVTAAQAGPPDTAILSHPPRRTRRRHLAFVLAGGSSYRFRVDRARWRWTGGDRVTVRLRPGAHRLLFQAIDSGGAADPTPASFRVRVMRW